MISEHTFALAFGIIGNLISFLVFLAPVPTFYRVWKRKSTEGFDSEPYLMALFSCMLWIYYALVKTNSVLLISINSTGFLIETIYILIFLTYAPIHAKKRTVWILIFLNMLLFGGILPATLLLCHGHLRFVILGWICVGFSVLVFVAPLSVMMKVIRTRSVEFMPLRLSVFLTISAVVWLGYGVLSRDGFVAVPNVLGMVCGVVQMVLYCIYKDSEPDLSNPLNLEIVVPEITVVVSIDIPSDRRSRER